MSAGLSEPFQLGDLKLSNRMVMAPMTRNRADENGAVPPITPGIYADAQAASWLRVTDAVRPAGGRVFVRLQHRGQAGRYFS